MKRLILVTFCVGLVFLSAVHFASAGADLPKAAPAQVESPAVQTETAAVQVESSQAQPVAPAVQAESPAVQMESSKAPVESPAAQGESPSMQTEVPAAQTEAPAAQAESPVPQAESPTVPAEASNSLVESPTAQEQEAVPVESPAAPTESTKAQVEPAKAQTDPAKVPSKPRPAQSAQASKRTTAPIPKTACPGALKLMRDVHLRAEKTPLADVLKDLEAQTGVKITADYPALETLGIRADTPVTAHVKKVTFESAMGLILRHWPVQCRMSEDGKSLILSTPAALSVWENPLKAQNEKHLLQLLTTPVNAESSEFVPCEVAAAELAKKAGIPLWIHPDLRLLSENPFEEDLDEDDTYGKTKLHFQNVSLDSALKRAYSNFDNPSLVLENEMFKLVPAYSARYPSPEHSWAFTTEHLKNPLKDANEEKIRKTLEQTTDVSFEEIPYADALLMLGELHDIPVWLTRESIEDSRVSVKVANVPLEDAFTKLLQGIDMCGVIQCEAYRIIYRPFDGEWFDDLEFREHPEDLEEDWGASPLRKTMFPCQRMLLQNQQAEEILHRPVSLTTDMSSPLEDLQSLAKQANVGILLDASALDEQDEANANDFYLKRNTFQLPTMTLESALKALFLDWNLDFCVQNGVIKISTPEKIALQNEKFRPKNTVRQEREKAIVQVLEKETDFHVQDVPLRDLVRTLRKKWGITILLDDNLPNDARVSFGGFEKLPNMLSLKLALRPLHLELQLQDETLQIVTEEDMRNSLRFHQLEENMDVFQWTTALEKRLNKQRKLLNQRITLSMKDVPLREVLQTLSVMYGFSYYLDETSLGQYEQMPNGLWMERKEREAKGLPPGKPLTADERVSFDAKGKRLHCVISDILSKYRIAGDLELGVLYLEWRPSPL